MNKKIVVDLRTMKDILTSCGYLHRDGPDYWFESIYEEEGLVFDMVEIPKTTIVTVDGDRQVGKSTVGADFLHRALKEHPNGKCLYVSPSSLHMAFARRLMGHHERVDFSTAKNLAQFVKGRHYKAVVIDECKELGGADLKSMFLAGTRIMVIRPHVDLNKIKSASGTVTHTIAGLEDHSVNWAEMT